MLQRIMNLIRGFVGLFVSGVERRSPEALLEVEKENLRKQIGQFNQGLASHAGLCERLIAQIRKLETEQRDLRSKTTAHLKAGNQEVAGQYALRLQTVERELGENHGQLQQAEVTYRDLVKARDVAISNARAKLEALKASISDLKVKRALAELTEMAAGMITTIGGRGDTLDRLHEMVEDERQKAAGRVRVARDGVQMAEVQVKETEQKALADQALADFAAREGIALHPTSPVSGGAQAREAPTKTMGPGVEENN